MATGEVLDAPTDAAALPLSGEQAHVTPAADSLAMGLLHALASLRLTVVLFALLIFLVFVGTLAQVDHEIWHVVNHTYFRVWVAQIEWRALGRLVGMFTDFDPERVTSWFPFPGGRTIGLALAANLLAAHAVRFKTAAKGRRLAAGLGMIALGVVATIGVVASGMDNAVKSELTPEFCNWFWQALRAAWVGAALVGIYWVATLWKKIGWVEWGVAAALVATVAGSALFLLIDSDWRLNDPSLRILWQLTKSTGAAAVLLIGCVMAFKKRAGIVLLHGGVGLLLASELMTDLTANEAQMSIVEGQTANYAFDIRTVELAIVDRSGTAADRVVVVPKGKLVAADGGEPISHPDLPFDVRVIDFYKNSELRRATGDADNPATAGFGLQTTATEVRSVNGIANQGINQPSAYVEVLDKASGKSRGVYLVSSIIDRPELDRPGQPVQTSAGEFDIALRFKRKYKSYAVTLNDFRFDRYVGTNTAKNFSSDVRLVDAGRSIDREYRISMNNPLRYGGDTLYQQNFDRKTEQTTVLQVVTNRGWMLPYVSLMIVGIGMLYQFVVTLARFTSRRMNDARKAAAQTDATASAGLRFSSAAVWFPLVMAVLIGGYLASKARTPKDDPLTVQVNAFGALPIAEGGRIKPYDTLARTKLQFISGRQTIKLEDGAKLPAITWLLDVISGKEIADDYRIFRIENLDLLDTLGLEPRKGFFRYSYNEVQSIAGEFDKQRRLIRDIPAEQRTVFQKKVGELVSRMSVYELLIGPFRSPRFSGNPASVRQEMTLNGQFIEQLHNLEAVRAVPPVEAGGEWLTLFEAKQNDLINLARGVDRNQATTALSGALVAYEKGDRREFNNQVRRLQGMMAKLESAQNDPANAEQVAGMALAERINLKTIKFETFFSAFSPFYYCAACYVIAFVLAVASWLGWTRPLSRAATAVIVVTLLVHTFAVVGRIYISGRPPVTNLYSSAVFIGWAAVAFGLVFELLYKIGVGNVVASVIGFLTLVVAHQLSLDGDTFTVMQAVLDTQFWLATHVVTITLGYATTFLAGLLGVVYLIGHHAAGRMSKEAAQQVTRMTYGVLCFAMLLSFVGTVLGGLWADDSWGRFWGWDPKENGALIIVLWNALILHARWGAMVQARGLATLAVLGNVVTAWSWFGVNELGVGLHAYGASERNTAYWLLTFAVSQMLIALLAIVPSADSRGPHAAAHAYA